MATPSFNYYNRRYEQKEALERYLSKINEHEKHMEKAGLSLLQKLEEMEQRTELMSIRLKKLKILKNQYFPFIKEQFRKEEKIHIPQSIKTKSDYFHCGTSKQDMLSVKDQMDFYLKSSFSRPNIFSAHDPKTFSNNEFTYLTPFTDSKAEHNENFLMNLLHRPTSNDIFTQTEEMPSNIHSTMCIDSTKSIYLGNTDMIHSAELKNLPYKFPLNNSSNTVDFHAEEDASAKNITPNLFTGKGMHLKEQEELFHETISRKSGEFNETVSVSSSYPTNNTKQLILSVEAEKYSLSNHSLNEKVLALPNSKNNKNISNLNDSMDYSLQNSEERKKSEDVISFDVESDNPKHFIKTALVHDHYSAEKRTTAQISNNDHDSCSLKKMSSSVLKTVAIDDNVTRKEDFIDPSINDMTASHEDQDLTVNVTKNSDNFLKKNGGKETANGLEDKIHCNLHVSGNIPEEKFEESGLKNTLFQHEKNPSESNKDIIKNVSEKKACVKEPKNFLENYQLVPDTENLHNKDNIQLLPNTKNEISRIESSLNKMNRSSERSIGKHAASSNSEDSIIQTDSEDSFFDKDMPLTSTPAYQSLIGILPVPQKVYEPSESGSEDEVEHAFAKAVEEPSLEKSDFRKPSVKNKKPEKEPKDLKSKIISSRKASIPSSAQKLSKATKKALGLDSDSDDTVQVSSIKKKTDADEESDEFDFYN